MAIDLTPISVASALVSATRAAQNDTLAALDGDALASLLSAATAAIQRYCKREFFLDTRTVYLDGYANGVQEIRLPEFPVSSVSRVAASPTAVLTVRNTDGTTNQRATVATSATGLTLYRVASAVPTSTALTYAAYPTLTALASAVSALSGGWAATVAPGYALHPSADLRPLQGAVTCIAPSGGADLEMYLEDLPAWGSGGGDGYYGGYGWRLDADSGQLFGIFPRGVRNVAVVFTAGFEEIPETLQEACVLMAQWLYQTEQANNALASASVDDASVTFATNKTGILPPEVRALVNPYVDHAALLTS